MSSHFSNMRRKMDRAIRNGTGMTVSKDEVSAFIKSPAWMLLLQKEREELLAMAGEASDIVTAYPAVVEKAGQRFSVFFPDLAGCTSSGTTVNDALLNAEEALSGHLEVLRDSGESPPPPSQVNEVQVDPQIESVTIALVSTR